MRALEIDHVNHHRFTKLAKALGKPVSEVAEEALNEWMECNGVPILKTIERLQKQRQAGQLLEFPGGKTSGRKPRKPKK